ncbi:PREDICTED: pEARLI1-like lipid transfer protein 2 [Camelina sativa]|uniref:PEARLI1-like lipid transfer protein 2 n=1 Tax=Camelina sativa TaxID=90675 RepID=A0ABM0XP71_CAMSA|nr:PREDICTED: pEARLI1-like lipid transfer protein 2 [Camelina sativa]
MDSIKLSSLSLYLFLIFIICFPQHSLSCGSCNPQKGGKPSVKPPVHVPKLPVPPVTVPKLPVPPVSGLPIPPVSGLPVPPVTVPKLPVPKIPVPPITVPSLPSKLPVPKLPVLPVSGLPIPPVSGLPVPPVTVPKLPVPKIPVPPITVPSLPPKLPVPKLPVPPVSGLPIPPVSGLPVPPVVGPNLPLPPLPIVGPILPPGTKPPAPGGGDCPPPPKSGKATCPINTLKLGACVELLGGLVKIGLGDPTVNKCCPLLKGLVEVEAAACLCTTLKINALDLKLYVPVALQLLLTCGKNPPPGYTCSI